MRKLWILLAFMAVAYTAAVAEEMGGYSYERYKILSSRNIFLKDRMPKPAVIQQNRKTILRDAPAHRKLLTGIVDSGFEHIAFFEDSSTRKTSRYRKGDAVSEKFITEITLDYIEYEDNGENKRIKVGESLVINAAASGSEEADLENRPGAVEIMPSTGTINAVPDEKTLLERMRMRRQRELQ